MSELKDMLEEVSVGYLERERDRLYAMQKQISLSLGEVKAELMRRALVEQGYVNKMKKPGEDS